MKEGLDIPAAPPRLLRRLAGFPTVGFPPPAAPSELFIALVWPLFLCGSSSSPCFGG
jgi:hypothetical protein